MELKEIMELKNFVVVGNTINEDKYAYKIKKGLLENTVFVLYGDHDARLPRNDYERLYNYDKTTDDILDKEDPNYKEYDSYQYELGRKVPFIIWTKNMKDTKL